jgi:hypothetical protein
MSAAKKKAQHAQGPDADEIGDGLAAVAQALINISEGLTTIEDGSRLTRGMDLLMRPGNANAMLAAPDLLEALEKHLAWYGGKTGIDEGELIASTRAAIAKARGQS